MADTPFQTVQTQAFAILARPQLARIADQIASNASFDETSLPMGPYRQPGPPVQASFASHPVGGGVRRRPGAGYPSAPLLAAVHFLQTRIAQGKATLARSPLPSSPPVSSQPISNATSIISDRRGRKRLLPDRYEFLIYRLLRQGLEAGDLFCRDSVRFRSFEDDLLDDQHWQAKEALMVDTGLSILLQPIQEHLATLKQRLEERLVTVNQRIATGENEHFQIKRRGQRVHWTLQYPRSVEP